MPDKARGPYRTVSEERFLEIIGIVGVVDRSLLMEKTGCSKATIDDKLHKLYANEKLKRGAALKIKTRRPVLVYTLSGRAKNFHHTSTDLYESINMESKMK